MKKLLIIVLVGFASLTLTAQPPKAIQDIIDNVEEINNAIGDSIREYDTAFKRPAKIDIWIHDNQIKKIIVDQLLPYANSLTYYYFKYSSLVYVKHTFLSEEYHKKEIKEYGFAGTDSVVVQEGYFEYDELLSKDYLIFEGDDTLFWGVEMQKQGYTLFDKYRKHLDYNPYKTLEYDSVVAYDFRGEGGGSITDGKGRLDKTAKNGTTFSQAQIDSLITTVVDTSSYGGFSAACFDPHMGIVFYNEGKVVSKIDVCFECNYLVSSETLHAPRYHTNRSFGDDYMITTPKYGFSYEGR